jgi:hypothetical protein
MKPAIKATLIFPLVIASIVFFVWFMATHETFVLVTFIPALLLISAGLIWYALYIGFGGKEAERKAIEAVEKLYAENGEALKQLTEKLKND